MNPENLEADGSYLPGTGLPLESSSNKEPVLDPHETTERAEPLSRSVWKRPDPTVLNGVFRHTGWAPRRKLVHQALANADMSNARRNRFATCGSQGWVLRSTEDPSEFRFIPDFCRDRWCTPCAQSRARRICANLAERLPGKDLRFLTLTLRRDDLPLSERVNRLLRSFYKLRRSGFWKSHVVGGVGMLEITRGASGDHWHPHLHIVAEGGYLPKDQLAELWLRITGDSFVIDLQRVKSQSHVLWYVTKYTTKPVASSFVHQPESLAEAIAALRGRKLLYSFGTWAKWRLLALPTAEGWTLYGHLNELTYREANGDELAHDVLLALQYFPSALTGDAFCVDLYPEPPPCQSKSPSSSTPSSTSQTRFNWKPASCDSLRSCDDASY